MIKNEKKFRKWITKDEKGSNSKIKHTTNSKISNLNVVSILIGETISEKNLFNEICVEKISNKLRPYRNEKSILEYKIVLKQYAQMVQHLLKNTLVKTK